MVDRAHPLVPRDLINQLASSIYAAEQHHGRNVASRLFRTHLRPLIQRNGLHYFLAISGKDVENTMYLSTASMWSGSGKVEPVLFG